MILVTGASGFLGRHLVEVLAGKGQKIRALFNNTAPSEYLRSLPEVAWLPCDLLDVFAVEEVMQEVTHVYHCAAIISFHSNDKDKMLHFNVESTANIVNESLKQNIEKLLFVSSVAALGRSEGNQNITEEEQWEESKYNSHYGLSKHMAETEVWRGIGEGLNAAIVNPSIIIGEGDWEKGSARLMKVVNKEFPFYTKGINGWVDVKDVARAMIQLMGSDISGERFIISGGNFSYKEIFTKMANALSKKPPHISASKFLTALVWRFSILKSLFTGEDATITKETSVTAQKQVFYDNTKLSQFLSSFSYTPIDDTIKRMAQSFLAKEHS